MLNVLPIPGTSVSVLPGGVGEGAPFLFQPPLPRLLVPPSPFLEGLDLQVLLSLLFSSFVCSWMFCPLLGRRAHSRICCPLLLSPRHSAVTPRSATTCAPASTQVMPAGATAAPHVRAAGEAAGPPSTATSSDIRPSSSLELSLPPVGAGGPLEGRPWRLPMCPGGQLSFAPTF